MNRQRLGLRTLTMLAWRNLWRHRRRTIITLTSISLGFGLSVFSISLGDGGHNNMIKNAIDFGEGHIAIQTTDYLQAPANYKFIADQNPIIERLQQLNLQGKIAPRIALQVLVSSANNSIGAALQSIDMEKDPRVEKLKTQLVDGRWLTNNEQRGVLIGEGMARKLKVKLGSKIVLLVGKKGGDSEAQLARVRGIFKTAMVELDSFLILSNLQFGQRYLSSEDQANPNAVTRLAIFLDEHDSLPYWHQEIKTALKNFNVAVLSWEEMMPELVQYILVDDIGNYIMLILILAVIVFGIINTVLMSVLERTREFGLLRAIGINRGHLLLLVFFESIWLSLFSVAGGWIIGGGIYWYFSTVGLDITGMIPEGTSFGGTFMDPIMYAELSMQRVTQITVIVFFTTLASGIYPAIKAARITPVQALRT
ncbi:MAG: ABC transporter permease [Gammaproteobacteria bacterium]|nr:ABC transporter permease [Gammaproteobacteria bacterium]